MSLRVPARTAAMVQPGHEDLVELLVGRGALHLLQPPLLLGGRLAGQGDAQLVGGVDDILVQLHVLLSDDAADLPDPGVAAPRGGHLPSRHLPQTRLPHGGEQGQVGGTELCRYARGGQRDGR
jgi:hypothetical protein